MTHRGERGQEKPERMGLSFGHVVGNTSTPEPLHVR